ncbi:hypothetical protein [Pseudorhodoferax soli]|uniref:Uncharacterized protein n=1 Tax=Pseudorhodoferax soli TaxID=545864 RepID=A0A368XNT5_9BURK|nr:hypothetical protein [Pseudorhodoferax soli]RCW69219.1 hypothetical protein DES41_10690 [Pseudorhodoferax soli]
MTKHTIEDQAATKELLRQLDADTTWLRHRGRAAELDRRLLQGATEDELSEVRVSWRGHVTHLRKEHRLVVVETSPSFWKITGSDEDLASILPPAEGPIDELAGDLDYEDQESGHPAHSTLEPGSYQLRIYETARALSVLATSGLLGSELLKASVGMLIRQASESNHWHNCTHYRSRRAAELIRRHKAINPGSLSTAAKYQAFCRANLRHEHVVPNSVIYRLLKTSEDHSVDAIVRTLSIYCIRATIALDEDVKLSRAGLSSSMPNGFFNESARELFKNPLARYIVTELESELDRRPEGKLWHEVS